MGAVAGALTGLLALGVTASAESPGIDGAEAFIKSLADSAIEALRDERVTLEDREAVSVSPSYHTSIGDPQSAKKPRFAHEDDW